MQPAVIGVYLPARSDAVADIAFNAPVLYFTRIYVFGFTVGGNGHNHVVSVNIIEIYAIK